MWGQRCGEGCCGLIWGYKCSWSTVRACQAPVGSGGTGRCHRKEETTREGCTEEQSWSRLLKAAAMACAEAPEWEPRLLSWGCGGRGSQQVMEFGRGKREKWDGEARDGVPLRFRWAVRGRNADAQPWDVLEKPRVRAGSSWHAY